MRDTKLQQIQKAQRENLKGNQRKRHITYTGTMLRVTADLFSEPLKQEDNGMLFLKG